MSTRRYCIIGAGPSGLTTAKHFAARDLPFDCFERESDIGGVWNPATGHGRVHASTQMISSKRLTEFTDLRMPREYPHFPSHEQALAYLRSYADTFDLWRHIRLDTEVQRLRRSKRGWEVWSSQKEGPQTYDGVVIANGHHCEPLWPDFPGSFDGECIHSCDYKSAVQLANRRVLVVGAGNSGCDIAVEAAAKASRAFLSLRRGYHVLPKFLFGAPIDRCGETMDGWKLPTWLNHLVLRTCLRVAVGSLVPYGWPHPDHQVFASHPIVNSQLLHHLGHRHIHVKPAVESLDGGCVRFVDGSTEEVDTIVCATGYKIGFPFSDEALFESNGRGPRLYLNMFPPQRDGLFFVGLIQPNGGIWQLADYQAQLLVRFLAAAERDHAAADWLRQQISRHQSSRRYRLRYVDSPRHALEVEYFAYRRELQGVIREFDRRLLR